MRQQLWRRPALAALRFVWRIFRCVGLGTGKRPQKQGRAEGPSHLQRRSWNGLSALDPADDRKPGALPQAGIVLGRWSAAIPHPRRTAILGWRDVLGHWSPLFHAAAWSSQAGDRVGPLARSHSAPTAHRHPGTEGRVGRFGPPFFRAKGAYHPSLGQRPR